MLQSRHDLLTSHLVAFVVFGCHLKAIYCSYLGNLTRIGGKTSLEATITLLNLTADSAVIDELIRFFVVAKFTVSSENLKAFRAWTSDVSSMRLSRGLMVSALICYSTISSVTRKASFVYAVSQTFFSNLGTTSKNLTSYTV